jgi:hypothetical protein
LECDSDWTRTDEFFEFPKKSEKEKGADRAALTAREERGGR